MAFLDTFTLDPKALKPFMLTAGQAESPGWKFGGNGLQENES